MKILQISPYAMNRPGGVQRHVRDLSHWLRAQGHDVRIIAPPSGGDEDVFALGRSRVIGMHGTAFEVTRAGRHELAGCVRDMKDWGAEIMHLHTPWVPMLGYQVWRATGLPAVATFHATLPENAGFDPISALLRRSARRYHRRLHRIAVPSDAPLDQWRRLGVSPEPLVIPPAIDLSPFVAAATASSPSAAFRVVHIGRLEERKGLKYLLECWPTVTAALPNAKLVIAGDGPELPALRKAAATLKDVQFLPPQSDEGLRALLASAHVFAAPALGGESFGLSLLEAMAANAVPVAADNAGFSGLLGEKCRDLLVPRQNAPALAAKLIAMGRNKDELDRLRAAAAQRAGQFDISAVGPQIESMIAAALA